MRPNWKAVAAQIDDCKYLDVRSIELVSGFGLQIIVQELQPKLFPDDPQRDFVPELAAKLIAERKAMNLPKPRAFRIFFREIISYTVENESYGKFPQAPEVFAGKLFRVFEWSYLLELTRKTTYASDEHPSPGPLQHYSIVGQDEVVDVIASREPEIKQIPPLST